jgi:4-hydroxy-2-oxoheptanedioate aldolase
MTSLRKMLADGKPLLGLSVMYPSPGAIERVGPDWDWMWIDGQHGELGYEQTLSLVRASDLIQRPAVVRVPGHEFGPIGKALDMGAAAVIAPCVDTPEQARAVVDAAKFPPLGKRSYGGRRPIDFHGRNYSDTANADTLLIAQIESPQAIENADAIAAVPGVDALFLGPDDLMLRRGFSMTETKSKETLGKDMEIVASACRKHGKVGVMVGVGEEMLRLCLSMGFQMIVGGSDVGFLAGGSKQAVGDARKVIGMAKPAASAAGADTKSIY